MQRAGFVRSLAALTLLATLSACGSAQRPASATLEPASPPHASAGAAATTMDEEARAPSPSAAPEALYRAPVRETPTDVTPTSAPPPSAAPTTPAALPTRPAPDASFGVAPRGGGAGDVGAQEELMRRNEAALAAALGECRTICSAAGNICVAAGEVCRLVGAGDTRCDRARGRCADAGRRRDGACPTCPSTR